MSDYLTDSQRFAPEALVPLTELQKAPGRIIRRVQQAAHPFLVLDRGKPAALLINQAQYDALRGATPQPSPQKTQRKRLLANALQAMLPVIIAQYKPERIILFGSLATGRVSETSDIDLVIVKKTGRRPIERQKELVRLVQPEIATDFFVYTPQEFAKGMREKPHFFATEILGKGHVLYDKAARHH